MNIIRYMLAGVFSVLVGCGGGGPTVETGVAIPQPGDTRTLYYGYYGTGPGQIAETGDHTNLHIELGWAGEAASFASIAEAKKATIFGLQSYVWNWNPGFTLHAAAETNIRGVLPRLRDAGLLHYIVALYPVDEPNLNVSNRTDLPVVVDMVKRVAKEFPELANVKIASIYAANGDYPYLTMFDWVGLDDYSLGAEILGATYNTFKGHLRSDNRIMLVPGGYLGQNPQPFIDKALNDAQVVAVIPFIWIDNADPANGVVQGIRSNGSAPSYIAAGKCVIGMGC